jgi:hypothetical protein
MLNGILIGVAATVIGGLIIYHVFGIGKEKKPLPLARALKFELEKRSPSFNPNLTAADGLVERLSANIHLRISNLSSKKVTIRNPQANLQLPDGYGSSVQSSDFYNDRDIKGEDFLSSWFVFSVRIVGDNQFSKNEGEWETNRAKILSNFSTAKVRFKFTADVVSNDDSKAIEEVFDITSAALPWLKK